MTPPGLAPAFDIAVRFDLDLEVPTLSGARGFLRAASGTISSAIPDAGLEGTVEPQAGDWLLRRPDGVLVNDQRIVFTLAPGRHLYMRNLGFTDPGGAFRCTPRFDIAAGAHDWVTRTVFTGLGRLDAEGFEIRVWRMED